jgi:hypothetical protein
MKNIHFIQTDKPSRLAILGMSNTLQLFDKPITFKTFGRSPQNIYITNNQLNCKNSWVYNSITKKVYLMQGYGGVVPHINKIILTTDQDLIKDGVQAIDDEFLEWFVKNPSCEEVEVERGYLGMGGFVKSSEPISKDKLEYKIFIPKEEPQQELPQFGTEEFYTLFSHLCDKLLGGKPSTKLHKGEVVDESYPKEFKQETLEEYFLANIKNVLQFGNDAQAIRFMEKYFEAKQEKSYSEEEVKLAFIEGHNVCRCVTDNTDEAKECFEEWFNKIKKK